MFSGRTLGGYVPNLLKCLGIQLVVAAFLLTPIRGVVAESELPEPSRPESELLKEAIANQTTGRMPGAHIVAVACDPTADPAHDNDDGKDTQVDQYFPNKSCANQSLSSDASGKPLPITKDNFAVKIAFDPTYHTGDYGGTKFEVTTPGPLKLPDGIVDFYDANGVKLAITVDDLVLGDEGEPVTYNGDPVYKAATPVIYPQGGDILTGPDMDANGVPIAGTGGKTQVYSKACNGYSVGTKLTYVNGQPIYTKDCVAVTDCRVPAVAAVAGAEMYMLNSAKECKLSMFPAAKVITVRGEDTKQNVATSLFIARFFNDYSTTEKQSIQNLKPSEASIWLKHGETVSLHERTRVSFSLIYEGDKACVYAYPQDPTIKWRVEGESEPGKNDGAPTTMEQVVDTIFIPDANDSTRGRMAPFSSDVASKHCVPAPYAAAPIKITFGSMISKVCTDFDDKDFKKDWHWPKAFTGIVVQCIEETMLNIFVPETVGGTANGVQYTVSSHTFFQDVQNRLKDAVRALFALYIIFFGYKLMVGKEVPKREEWMWLGLKFALVMYFALGAGMVNLLPKMLNVSKSLSLIVMEAGLGEQSPELAAAQWAKANASSAVLDAQNEINEKANELAKLKSRGAVSEQEIADAQKNYDDLLKLLEQARIKMEGEDGKGGAQKAKDDAQKKYNDALALLSGPQSKYNTAVSTRDALQEYINNYVTMNQVGNGDFETYSGANYGINSSVGDWKSDIGAGIEVQQYGGNNIIELDSKNNSNMYQNINVYSGGSYTLSFDYSPRPSISGFSNAPENYTIEVYINGALKGSYSGITSGRAFEFSNKTITFTTSQDGAARVEFRAAGISDSVGGLVDNVVLKANGIPKSLSDKLKAAEAAVVNAATPLCAAGGVCHGNIMGVVDGGYLSSSQLQLAKNALDVATTEYDIAKTEYDRIANLLKLAKNALDDATNFSKTKNDLIKEAEAELARLNKQLADLKATENAKIAELKVVRDALNSNPSTKNIGYDYCDFRALDYEKNYMKLWDMIDCKLSSYLGLGLNDKNLDEPRVLTTGITAIFSTEYGIPIFIFTIIFLVFIILIIIRVVHIYIMAIVGVSLLAYIAPLIIPAALFNYTKEIFNSWVTQIIGCLLQPVLMFAFMAFMLAAIDSVVYENNHNFVTVNNMPVNTRIMSNEGSGPAKEYKDCTKTGETGSMGCIYQTLTFFNDGYNERLSDGKIHKVNFNEDNRDFYVFIGLLKLILICFIAQVMLATVEQLSSQLTGVMGAVGGGLTSMSAIPSANIAATIGQIQSKTGMAVNAPGKVYDAAKSANEKKAAARKGLGNMKQYMKDKKAIHGAADKAQVDSKAKNANLQMQKDANRGDVAKHGNRQMMLKEQADKAKAADKAHENKPLPQVGGGASTTQNTPTQTPQGNARHQFVKGNNPMQQGGGGTGNPQQSAATPAANKPTTVQRSGVKLLPPTPPKKGDV
jgi:type IV secretory pathway VirB6-like protein